MPDRERTKLSISAGVLSVTVALLLVGAKLWALAATNSLSIAATLADSALDLLMSLGGLAAIIYASKPADDDHAFGHTSAEDLAALAQSVFIMVSACAIAIAAYLRLTSDAVSPVAREGAGMVVMVFSIVVTLILVAWQRYVSKRTGNKVVEADSLHYVGDLIPNMGALIALWLNAQFGLGSVDSIVALLAALLMAVGAIRIGKQAFDALMDRAASNDFIADVEKIVGEFPGVHGFHDLKTRRAGSRVFLNIHIELDGSQTLDEAHSIGAALRRAIVAARPEADVLIHKDPIGVERHPDDPRNA
ncbi:cation diffusion facilitator family transporter [Marivivens donghaensis]|uniref:Cation diffusion facilitator family transporter n=1 Tax=Marivivens donghaensis TaxID=1699413 RepID=A0ABX0VTA4_9RHOB|nr:MULTISPECIES: cation diffusion facilitator family transporter [Marivivens]NIY71204.1 cation diffusion facilitator family transporter [Marivivens donghaensis]